MTNSQPGRILRVREMCAYVGLSRPTVWRLMRAGRFPSSIELAGPQTIGWLKEELDQWIEGLRQKLPLAQGRHERRAYNRSITGRRTAGAARSQKRAVPGKHCSNNPKAQRPARLCLQPGGPTYVSRPHSRRPPRPVTRPHPAGVQPPWSKISNAARRRADGLTAAHGDVARLNLKIAGVDLAASSRRGARQ